MPPNAEIESLYAAWRRAFAMRDVSGILALLTDDYLLWAPGRPSVGRDVLKPQLEAAFEAYDVEPGFECEERIIVGDVAVDRGWDVQTLRPRDGGAPSTQRQRVFLVLRRAADGRWRFARGMSQPGPAA